ncbi:hypothetical protein [Knoellia aerolata]|uniref:Uncharacterized protein n=1 Tax=Knoellia aerolata DSM 18566 TaxID=1385519 RepID=A0A0A0JZT2_9MICO|nr:hypothetical protein [Knoellia aerolata]KGN41011.1 hypothetical protein N801_10025 [Knoellia aerolata DSM 18566]
MTFPNAALAACRAVIPASVSALVLVVVSAQLPAVAGLALVAAVVAGTTLLRCGVGEGIASRVLHGARAPTQVEAVVLGPAMTLLCGAALGPPLVRVRVQPRNLGLLAQPWGHATVVVPRGLVLAVFHGRVRHEQAAANLAHAAGTCRSGATGGLPAMALWCLPWLLLEEIVTVAGRGMRSSPMLRLAWHTRFVVAAIAVAQNVLGGRLWLAAVVAGIAAATYTQPALNRSWHRRVLAVGDGGVIDAGLGRPYAAMLVTSDHVIGLERLGQLTGKSGP